MKFRHLLVASGILLAGHVFAQAPTKQWDRTLGGSDEERLAGIQTTRDGGSILVGASASPRSGDKTQDGQGTDDAWVVKIDAQGRKQWDRTLGGSDYDGAISVQQTADGGYLVGAQSTSPNSGDKTQASQGNVDYWVIKLDAQGHTQWDRTLGGSGSDALVSVLTTADGGYLLGGTSSSAASGDKTEASWGRSDYWVVKLDSQGAKQWDRTLGGTGQEVFSSMQQTVDGGYLLGGYSASNISGDKTQASQGGIDYWLVKLNGQGATQWDRTLGGDSNDYLRELQLTADGGALLAGSSLSGASGDKSQPNLGLRDYWLVQVDAQGNKQWDRSYGTDKEDYLAGVTLTQDGGCLLGGNDFSTYSVLKLDAHGSKQWEQTLRAGDSYTQLVQVRTAADGGYLLAGMSTGDAVGNKSEPSRGGEFYGDYWLVKLSSTVLTNQSAPARDAWRVYPNPAQGSFTVQLPADAPSVGLQLQLVDALGRSVLRQQLPAATVVNVSVGAVPAGLYWLRLSGPPSYQATQRIVLE
ncbi:T9SS type A sorting domain-containing protein [Hymenobacter sp. GOD-10R]|uniref:T9SS type A sorting domain-containing protein n=1 Tax=Hymenobacter sp. GOD-10R TaxID=3093922 RepID=UPI002D78C39D|nr:T9SS type A sorting domain-containing protein [Hymenobacter sp. GOD-10R]WRQ27879.1 T9SS type A sorting domain-containing protein [Hymenobacter sp. GOD-10R]